MNRSNLSSLAGRIAILMVLVLATGWAEKFAQADEFLPADFVPLFNGKDFTGWRFGDESATPNQVPAGWKIEQGVIVGQGDSKAMLASQWDYSDFELEFEWKAGDDVDADLSPVASLKR